MDELRISVNEDGFKGPNEENIISVLTREKELSYKFIIGNDGIWNTIQDYSRSNICKWIPKEEGKYMIMVQGKKEGSSKPFDFMAKEEIIVDNSRNFKIIRDVKVDNKTLLIGEKNSIEVISDESQILYRFWKVGKNGWEPLRDYSIDNKYMYTANEKGDIEILIECKRLNSKEKVDEFITVKFEVEEPLKPEIIDFKCLSDERLINSELIFKVNTSLDENRSIIYKFVKINSDGKCECIQDYSSRKTVNFQEKTPGKYKLLCLVRDLLSNQDYDDRAIINYDVKPYKNIKIQSVKTDLNSPQMKKTLINIKVSAIGGRQLVYRYIIDGSVSVDTGYIRNSQFSWSPDEAGKYNITVLIKDISFNGEYEDKYLLEYVIDERADKPVRISDIIISDKNKVLVGETLNIKVISDGGIKPLYSFIVYKDSIEKERIDYSVANWANFIPEQKGDYEIEVRVKDKYSSREFDSNTFINIKAQDYIPADIDYILFKSDEKYIVGDEITLEAITENTGNVLIKYIVKINGHIVEEVDYSKNKRINIKPKCSGKYTIEILAKNILCLEGYDSKKEVSVYVLDSLPVRETTIQIDNEDIHVNEPVTFRVSSRGGRQVCYEFYINEGGNWVKLQSYSKKDYYTFIPYLRGEYRLMVMAKSFYRKVNYEDYKEIIFNVC